MMSLTIERSTLLKSLQHVQSVVERRNSIPILSNVLMSAEGGALSLLATDMDIAVSDRVAADVAANGACTAPAHMLYDIVRKLPDGTQVELVHDAAGERVQVRAGSSSFMLPCLPTEDFPAMTEGELPHSFALPAPDLRRLIDKTRFAISTEETRYYLNGIYLHVADIGGGGEGGGGEELCAVATDGHRLARVGVGLPDGAAGMPGVIVPRKTVIELRKLIDDSEDDVAVALSETKIRFTIGDAVLISKLIDGTFPDYARVIPEGNDKVLKVHGKAFIEAVDRVSTISSEKTRAIKLSIDRDTVVLSASSPDLASATEELPAEYESDALEIGFNSRYMLEMTQHITGDIVEFRMADPASPTIVGDTEDPGTLYVLMPLRV